MKRITAVILLLAFVLGSSGCTLGKSGMNDTLFSVLDVETRDFFESFTEDSAEFMTVNYDQHFAEAIVSDKDAMCAMVEALSDIKVAAKTDISSTDGYHSVGFITADGKKHTIRFENSALHYAGDNYVIENAEKFWNLFKATAEAGWDQAQENAAKYKSVPVSYADDTLAARVSCVLLSSEAKETDDKHWLDAFATLSFTNTGDAPIPGIDVKILFLNADGYIVGATAVTADFSAAPLAPDETCEYTVQSRVYDFSSAGASVGGMTGALVTVSGVSSEGSAAFETPLFEFYRDPDIAAFAEGFYDAPPQKLTVVRNRLSSSEIVITDKETIAEFFGALSQIRVGEAAAAPSSDSDTHYCFSYADGSEYTFSFNASGLMISTDEHPYQQCFRGSGGEDLGALTNQLFEQ